MSSERRQELIEEFDEIIAPFESVYYQVIQNLPFMYRIFERCYAQFIDELCERYIELKLEQDGEQE